MLILGCRSASVFGGKRPGNQTTRVLLSHPTHGRRIPSRWKSAVWRGETASRAHQWHPSCSDERSRPETDTLPSLMSMSMLRRCYDKEESRELPGGRYCWISRDTIAGERISGAAVPICGFHSLVAVGWCQRRWKMTLRWNDRLLILCLWISCLDRHVAAAIAVILLLLLLLLLPLRLWLSMSLGSFD